MIKIFGVPKQDRAHVAKALVLTLGCGGVCSKPIKCPNFGGNDCVICAAKNYIKFEDHPIKIK